MPILPFASMKTTSARQQTKLPNTTTNQLWPDSTYPATSEPMIKRISPVTWNEADQNTSDAPQLSLARLLHLLEPNASIQTTRLLNDCSGLLGALWDDKIWITEAASEALNQLLPLGGSESCDAASQYPSFTAAHSKQATKSTKSAPYAFKQPIKRSESAAVGRTRKRQGITLGRSNRGVEVKIAA